MLARVTNNFSLAKMALKLILTSSLLCSMSGYAYDHNYAADEEASWTDTDQNQGEDHDQSRQHKKTSTKHPRAKALGPTQAQIMPKQVCQQKLNFTPIGQAAQGTHKHRAKYTHPDNDDGADRPGQNNTVAMNPMQKKLYDRYGLSPWGYYNNSSYAHSIPRTYDGGEPIDDDVQPFVNHYYPTKNQTFAWVKNVHTLANTHQSFKKQQVRHLLISGKLEDENYASAKIEHVIFGNTTLDDGRRTWFNHRTNFNKAQIRNTIFADVNFEDVKWCGAHLYQPDKQNPVIFDNVKFRQSGMHGATIHVNGVDKYINHWLAKNLKREFGSQSFYGDLADLLDLLEGMLPCGGACQN